MPSPSSALSANFLGSNLTCRRFSPLITEHCERLRSFANPNTGLTGTSKGPGGGCRPQQPHHLQSLLQQFILSTVGTLTLRHNTQQRLHVFIVSVDHDLDCHRTPPL